jgi:hypothetical protein
LKFAKFSSMIVILLLAACTPGLSKEEMYQTAAVIALTSIAETSAAMPTNTPVPTDTPMPTETPTITPTATEIFTETPTGVPAVDTANSLAYFLIDIDSEDSSGCTYSTRAIYIGTNRTGDPIQDITNALNAMFSVHGSSVYGLANPLGDSSLQVGGVNKESENRVNVNIVGNLVRPPKGCAWGQMLDQIQVTARHAATGAWYVSFQFENKPLKDFLYTGA